MNSKLIIIEGLPGSGKTTTAKLVHEILNEFKVENKYCYEGDLNHPADYDGVAYFNGKEFNKLISEFKNEEDLIYKITTNKEEGYFLEYKKGKYINKIDFSEKIFNRFYNNDIYELPLDTHINLLTNKWKEFHKKASEEDMIYIFDCPFIQNPITVGMIRDNVDKKIIINYIKTLSEIIKDLNPLIIYLEQVDISHAFKKAIEERSEEWFEGFMNYYTNQGYGKDNKLEGLEGTLEVLKARKELESEILNELNLDIYILDNSDFNMDNHKNKLISIIKKYIKI